MALLALGFAAGYLLLLIPDSEAPPPDITPPANGFTNFLWKQDGVWEALEGEFANARLASPASSTSKLETLFHEAETAVAVAEAEPLEPSSEVFTRLEGSIFQLAPVVAAQPAGTSRYAALIHRAQAATKEQSWRSRWDMTSFAARACLYRLLAGSRQALDELLAQGISVPLRQSEAPALEGRSAKLVLPDGSALELRSGDLLLSRGDAPASALIARGNDFPGIFSHAAVAHVDAQTGQLCFVESLIRHGLVVTAPADYSSNKLRILVLRVRQDHPQLRHDPQAPHRAAEAIRRRARSEYVPYDFALDYRDHSKMFCSEVASSAYAFVGINLWMGMSHISSAGLKRWLSNFGVRHFETQEPSDLEYDPQLQVVAEWTGDLRKDREDTAAMDAMLEAAGSGASLRYSLWKLPPARIAKVAGAFARVFNHRASLPGADIPEGMSATAALRQVRLNETHRRIVENLRPRASAFQNRNGYAPPSWKLLKMARECFRDTSPERQGR